MDATGAYHRQMTREFRQASPSLHVVTPLMRLQDPDYTRIILVTCPRSRQFRRPRRCRKTCSAQASAICLGRQQIDRGHWHHDPLLQSRLQGEIAQMTRIRAGLSERCHIVPWLPEQPVGVAGLEQLL